MPLLLHHKKKKRITIVMDPCVNNIVNDIYFNKQASGNLANPSAIEEPSQNAEAKGTNTSMDKFLFYSHQSILQLMQSRRVVSNVARTLKLKALTPCVSHRLKSHRKPLKLKALTLSVKVESMDKFLFHSHQSILQLMQSQRAKIYY